MTTPKYYKSCTDCPCCERKDDKDWCFWYDSYVDITSTCGNYFTERPEKSQEQLHDEVFTPINCVIAACMDALMIDTPSCFKAIKLDSPNSVIVTDDDDKQYKVTIDIEEL